MIAEQRDRWGEDVDRWHDLWKRERRVWRDIERQRREREARDAATRGAKGGKSRAQRKAERNVGIIRNALDLRAEHLRTEQRLWSVPMIAKELAPLVRLSWRRVADIIRPALS